MDKKKNSTIKIEKPHLLGKAEKNLTQLKEKGKIGRPKVVPSVKASETITLKLTVAEKELFQSKAGDVPLGTFLKNYLKRETDLIG